MQLATRWMDLCDFTNICFRFQMSRVCGVCVCASISLYTPIIFFSFSGPYPLFDYLSKTAISCSLSGSAHQLQILAA